MIIPSSLRITPIPSILGSKDMPSFSTIPSISFLSSSGDSRDGKSDDITDFVPSADLLDRYDFVMASSSVANSMSALPDFGFP